MMLLKTSLVFLLLTVGYHLAEAQNLPICIPSETSVTVYENEMKSLMLMCNKVVPGTIEVIVFCFGITATPGVDTNAISYMFPLTGKKGSFDVTAKFDNLVEGTETMVCQSLTVTGAALSGKWIITIKECPSGEKYQSGNGATCDDPNTDAPTMDCWKCPYPEVWDEANNECLPSADACPQDCPPGQTWQMGDGKTCANPDPGPVKYGCYACPLGQFYNEIGHNCLTTDTSCPTKSAQVNGDPHYTTFDGTYYTIFPTGWFTAAKDCKEDPTWEVCHQASNRCSGGRAPTCSDAISVKLQCPGFNTTIKYNWWSNSYWFEGPTPSAEDAVITLSGRFFTVYLPKKKVTVKMYYTQITITLGGQWYGPNKVCGFFGNWDGNRANDIALPDGTPTHYNDINYIYAYSCQPTLPVPPPPPPTCDPGPRKDAAEAFCRVMYSNPGSYTACHAMFPPGNTYELPIDTPYEQCVYDNCVVEDEGEAEAGACTNILAYASQCRMQEFSIGDPPEPCKPTCPTGTIYKACGPLVAPSCDAPDGVDGCSEGCFCPDGEFLTRSGDCVSTCPCTVYFERNEVNTIEENGGFCVKLTRPGPTTTECPVTVTLDSQLSADATGTPAGDTCCGLKCPTNTPAACGGTTQCQLTIPADEDEACMWVKVDKDDSLEDRMVTLMTADDRARVSIKSAPSENCFSFGDRIGFVRTVSRVRKIKLSLASPAPKDTCVTVSTIDGSAKACTQYQGGKYKGCFAEGSEDTNIFFIGLRSNTAPFSCFYTTAEACEGEPELEICKYKYGFYYAYSKENSLPRHGKSRRLCYARPPTVGGLCKHDTVARVTMLGELMPDGCFVGYKAKVMEVYKGALTMGQEVTVWILPLIDCPDPDFAFSYGKDVVFAGSVDEGDKLLVEKNAFLSACVDWEDLKDSLCP